LQLISSSDPSLFQRPVALELEAKGADATIETMAPEPTAIHVPVLTGGLGTAELNHLYREWFIPSWPGDIEVEPISRTVGTQHRPPPMIRGNPRLAA
jgi:carboxymethylenebutenolidase